MLMTMTTTTTMSFWAVAFIIGSLTLAVVSTTALVTVLLRRRAASRPAKPWLERDLRNARISDEARAQKRLNPLLFPMEKA